MAYEEINLNADPVLARADLLEQFQAIFAWNSSRYALGVHQKLGFVALAEGTVEPYIFDNGLIYKDVRLTLARSTRQSDGHAIVRIWGFDKDSGAVDYDLDQTHLHQTEQDESLALRDRVLAHMCDRTRFEPLAAEVTLEGYMDYLELMEV